MIPQVDTQTLRPEVLPVRPEGIPAELKGVPHWVTWRFEYRDNRWTKPPYQVDGKHYAKANDPSTWGSFEKAMATYKLGVMNGVGFEPVPELGYVFVDIDHCVDIRARKLMPWAQEIIDRFDTYVERSPVDGVRIVTKGKLPRPGQKRGGIEVYSASHYLTITGGKLKNKPKVIQPCQDSIDWLLETYFKERERGEPNTERGDGNSVWHPSDEKLLEKAFRAANGDKLRRLLDGDTSGHRNDDSVADLALCSHLAFWTQDTAQIDRIFRSSGLMREKWDSPRGDSTYGAWTIQKALAGTTEHYQGRSHDGRKNSWSSFFSSPVDQPRPDLKPEALYGLAGDIVRGIEPFSEADPVAILTNILIGFGNLVGVAPYTRVEESAHHLNLFVVQVGDTSKGRKGTAWSTPKKMLRDVEPEWADKRVTGGLSSGEGLVYNVRDQRFATKPVREDGKVVGYEEILVDKGEEDKRLLLIEEEFSQALKVMSREGNILSPIIRQAWDHGNLRSLTKNDPNRATGAHISIVAHITRGELLRHLVENEQTNGFGNRFLWVCVSRSKSIPEPEPIAREILYPLTERMREAVNFAQSVGEMRRTPEARAEWAMVYPELSDAKPGLAGAMMARGEAQVLRLSCLYALLDLSDSIGIEHQRAALALWEYSEASVRAIFGGLSGDPNLDTVTAALTAKGQLTLTEMHGLFGRNVAAMEIERVVGVLIKTRVATVETVADERGRKSITVIRATNSTKSTKSTAQNS